MILCLNSRIILGVVGLLINLPPNLFAFSNGDIHQNGSLDFQINQTLDIQRREQLTFEPCRSFGKNYYFLYKTVSRSYHNAITACEEIYMNLSRVYSEDHWIFLKSFWESEGSSYTYWLGITDELDEGTWVQEGNLSLFFQDWAPNRPNTAIPNYDDCVIMGKYSNPQWHDTNCLQKHRVICESKFFKCDPGPINGQWSSWSNPPCSVTCGNGTITKRRTCNEPAPFNNGLPCPDPTNTTLIIVCITEITCPVHGKWSLWNDWSPCSKKCKGRKRRTRTCDNPAPIPPGKDCEGSATETVKCGVCKMDGEWGEFEPWGPCDAPCGQGMNTRVRKCNNPPPTNGGRRCLGDAFEEKPCQIKFCPVNGLWTVWEPWSSCSKSCSEGEKSRSRVCRDPEPAYGGLDCVGESFEAVPCILKECPGMNKWTEWSYWSECSETCGSDAARERSRTCKGLQGQSGLGKCPGSNFESRSCYLDPCPAPPENKKIENRILEKERESRSLIKILVISVGSIIGLFLLVSGVMIAIRKMEGHGDPKFSVYESSSSDEEER